MGIISFHFISLYFIWICYASRNTGDRNAIFKSSSASAITFELIIHLRIHCEIVFNPTFLSTIFSNKISWLYFQKSRQTCSPIKTTMAINCCMDSRLLNDGLFKQYWLFTCFFGFFNKLGDLSIQQQENNRSNFDVGWGGLVCSSSSQRCVVGLRSGLCPAHLIFFSTPILTIHVYMDLSLCTGTLECWTRFCFS